MFERELAISFAMSVSVSAMVPSFFVMCLVVSLLVPFSFFYHFPDFRHRGIVINFRYVFLKGFLFCGATYLSAVCLSYSEYFDIFIGWIFLC